MKRACAHCEAELEPKDVHWHHIPPKNLFPKGTVGIIQVPACRKCNNGDINDDEFFRLLALSMAAEMNTAAKEANAGSLKEIMRPESKKFCNALFSKMEPVILTSEMGLYVDETFKLKIDLPRLIRTVGKIARELYYHYKQRPISADYHIKVYCPNTMNEKQREPLRTLLLPPLLTEPVHEIGNGTFRYRLRSSSDDPNAGAFLLGFYEWVDFLVAVYPASLEPQLKKELKETGNGSC